MCCGCRTGGVELLTPNGKIKVINTLEKRLQSISEQVGGFFTTSCWLIFLWIVQSRRQKEVGMDPLPPPLCSIGTTFVPPTCAFVNFWLRLCLVPVSQVQGTEVSFGAHYAVLFKQEKTTFTLNLASYHPENFISWCVEKPYYR